MTLVALCIRVLARFPDQLHCHRRVPASPALLDALAHTRDPCLWAALAQLVHPLPPHLHDLDLPLSHPALPLLQKIPDSPDFSLVTLLSLPNCAHLRDDDTATLRTLHRLLALDLRGCSISSYALARLANRGLRLLSLHACPNIDNDALSVLHKLPLLSAIDLRFTRCTPSAVGAHLSPLGYRPSDNRSLFHPAPLSLALCSLEKVALTAPDPISLYSCPPQSLFRLHIDELGHPQKKVVPVDGPGTSQSTIRTISSAEDTVVFIPPLRETAKNESFPPSKPFASATAVPTSIEPPAHPSHVSSFYENAPAWNKRSRKSILPLSAQAVQSSKGVKLDPLAIARSPPPWMDTLAPSNPSISDNSRQTHSHWSGQALNNPLKVDRGRLHKRGSDAVADMVHQFASKRPKVESEFALEKTRAKVPVKSRNPFVRSARSVFAESTSDRPPVQSSKEAKPDVQLRACRSLPSKTEQQQGPNIERTLKPLKPITTLKPPILPKELLPPLPRHAPKPRSELKQTRLEFSREVG